MMFFYSKRAFRKFRRNVILLLISAAILSVLVYFIYSSLSSFLAPDKRYDRIIKETASRYNIDSRFIKAVIWQESNFNPSAKGRAGEIGLMQIIRNQAVEDWARFHNTRLPSRAALFDPRLNIEIGTWYLSRALNTWKNYLCCKELALCSYNAGPSMAEKWKPETLDGTVIDRITYKSTRKYVISIMEKYRELKKGDD